LNGPTSNTYWDWNLNQIGGVYGDGRRLPVCGDIQGVSASSFPPSFVPATIMEETIDEAKAKARIPTTTGSAR
jgi:arylsulfatase